MCSISCGCVFVFVYTELHQKRNILKKRVHLLHTLDLQPNVQLMVNISLTSHKFIEDRGKSQQNPLPTHKNIHIPTHALILYICKSVSAILE